MSRVAARRSRDSLYPLFRLIRPGAGGLGSRKNGGGFGGRIVSIARRDCQGNFKRAAGTGHAGGVGRAADFYIADHSADGARQLMEE